MNDEPTTVPEERAGVEFLAGPALSRPGRMPPPRAAIPPTRPETEAAEAVPVVEEPPMIELPAAAIESDAPPSADTGEEDRLGLALMEVAERLEGVAAALRTRSVGELLSARTDRDPLELLLTGFVLGHAGRRATVEPTPAEPAYEGAEPTAEE